MLVLICLSFNWTNYELNICMCASHIGVFLERLKNGWVVIAIGAGFENGHAFSYTVNLLLFSEYVHSNFIGPGNPASPSFMVVVNVIDSLSRLETSHNLSTSNAFE